MVVGRPLNLKDSALFPENVSAFFPVYVSAVFPELFRKKARQIPKKRGNIFQKIF